MPKLPRHRVVIVLLVWATVWAALDHAQADAAPAKLAGAARPNVIVVMSDDQGYGDFSCHGNPVLKTPNLDRLHDQGIRLTDFHVWRLGPGHLGAIVSVTTHEQRGPDYYQARLARFRSLSHVTVEVQRH